MIGRPSAAAERGAAMTEFVVLCMAMVPLMFGIPMIGKLIDVKHTAVQAGRYAAWESTVYAGGAPPGHVRARFFGEASAPIRSGASDGGRNALWGEADVPVRLRAATSDEGGPGALAFPGIVDGTRVSIDGHSVAAMPYTNAYASYRGHAVSEGIAHEMGEAIRRAGEAGAGLSSNSEWPLEGNGLQRGGVRVDTAPNGWLDTLSFEESSVIMSDGWSAPSEAAAETRVRSLVPAAGLDRIGIGDVLSAASVLPGFQELEPLDDAFGHVDMSELPEREAGVRELEAYEEER